MSPTTTVGMEAVSAMPDVLRILVPGGPRAVLLATRCTACGAVALGLRRHCLNCTSTHVNTLECSTQGALVNYTVVHRAAASWTGRVPYALGQVALAEGPVVTAEIIGVDLNRLAVGTPMRLTLEITGHDASGHPMLLHKWTG